MILLLTTMQLCLNLGLDCLISLNKVTARAAHSGDDLGIIYCAWAGSKHPAVVQVSQAQIIINLLQALGACPEADTQSDPQVDTRPRISLLLGFIYVLLVV